MGRATLKYSLTSSKDNARRKMIGIIIRKMKGGKRSAGTPHIIVNPIN